jgi:GNAT superfamily N-acetyltransferase
MQFIEVTNQPSWKLFHKVPHIIYKNDPNWICPLENDIENIFDPQKNKTFDHGEAKLWVLLDDAKQPIGRIAAFIDHKRNEQLEVPLGGIGYFESIDDQEVAFTLFKQAEDYLKSKGVKGVDGPINFGERDKFWGLLVKNYDPPLFQENYHPPYYKPFFENWGYEPYEQVLTMKGALNEVPVDRFGALANRMKERYPYRVESIDLNDLDQIAVHFAEVYNAAFSHFPYFKPLEPPLIKEALKQLRPIATNEMGCVAFYEDKPVGIAGLHPDINPFIRHAKGKLNWWKIPKFLYKLKFQHPRWLKGIIFGVHPEFQGKGVFALLIDHLSQTNNQFNLRQHSHLVLCTIRGHNQIMVNTMEKLAVKPDRVHIAYRKMLEPGLKVERLDFIEVD